MESLATQEHLAWWFNFPTHIWQQVDTHTGH